MQQRALGAEVRARRDLVKLQRHAEAMSVLRKMMPVARRVLGDSHEHTLQMRANYAKVIIETAATLDDFREAVIMLEENERIARRVLGGAHPTTVKIERALPTMRATLAAREDDVSAVRAALDAMKAA